MANNKQAEVEAPEEPVAFDDDGDQDAEEDLAGRDSLETDAVVDITDDDADADDESEASDSTALDELEADELEMLTEDEASEVIAIDEAAELLAIRREELALDIDPEGAGSDEFVCQSCFLVKRTSQLADAKKKICTDCA